MSEQKRTITPEEFAEYARENNATVIVVMPGDPQPNPYDPQPKGRAERLFQQQRRRDENRVINGVADFDRSVLHLADWLINKYSGVSFNHLRALTERAVEFIGARVVVEEDTVVRFERHAPDLPGEGEDVDHRPPSVAGAEIRNAGRVRSEANAKER